MSLLQLAPEPATSVPCRTCGIASSSPFTFGFFVHVRVITLLLPKLHCSFCFGSSFTAFQAAFRYSSSSTGISASSCGSLCTAQQNWKKPWPNSVLAKGLSLRHETCGLIHELLEYEVEIARIVSALFPELVIERVIYAKMREELI